MTSLPVSAEDLVATPASAATGASSPDQQTWRGSQQQQVREPEPSDTDAWTVLSEVAKWANLKGDFDWAPSPAGSLLRLVADDDDVGDLLISEFSSLPRSSSISPDGNTPRRTR